MQNRLYLTLVICLMWILTACTDPVFPYALQAPSPLSLPVSTQSFPKIIYYSEPNLSVIDTVPFSDTLRPSESLTEEEEAKRKAWQEAGYDCSIDPSQQRWEVNRESCQWAKLMLQTECDAVISPDPLWGGLEPNYPLAHCLIERVDHQTKKGYFYRSGGFMRYFHRYVIVRQGKIEEITTQAELQAIYAPITSANEALSYALLATGLTADFRRTFEGRLQDYQFFVEAFEQTHVKERAEGFEVLLYHTPLPCFTAFVDSVLVTVTQDGQISRSEPRKVYEQNNTVCAD